MDKIGKVKRYLKISGYSESRIEEVVSNEQYLDMIYGLVLQYENGINKINSEMNWNVNPIENYSDKKIK